MGGGKAALVVGVTGIVGNSLAEILQKPDAAAGGGGVPWRIHGIACRPKPSWFQHDDVNYIQCDLLNREETMAKLSPLHDLTHIFWVTWTKRSSEEEHCEANGRMLHNALDALLPVAKELKHICLQTGAKHYLGPYTNFGTIEHYEPPLHEQFPRVAGLPNFYYTLEDILLETCSSHPNLTWSVHRPNVIFGFAPRNYANVLGSIAIYAAICKHLGLSFAFPGSRLAWESITNVSDADLVAEQEIWAATNPQAKNTAFNIANGDYVVWRRLWHLLAEEFNLEVPEYSGHPTNLRELMRDKGHVWEEIVAKNSLVETQLQDEQWWAVDLCLNFPFQLVSCMNKSREHGFLSHRDTEKSATRWLNKMKEKNIIPSGNFWTKH